MQGCGRLPVPRAAVALAAALWVAVAASTTSALAAGQLTLAVQVGYHNTLKLSQWMPVSVDITNNGPDLEGTLEVQSSLRPGAGPPFGAAVYQAPVALAAGATKHFRTYVIQDYPASVTVRVVRAGRVVASQDVNSPNTTSGLLVAVLSDRPSTLDSLGSLHPGGNAPQVVHLAAAELPDSVPVLKAFDVIAIDDFATDTLTAAQKTALDDFVRQGGALLLGAGGAWRKTLSGLPSGVVPMQVTGSTVLDSAAALGGAPGVEVATGDIHPGATAWLADRGHPLVVEAPVGRGIVMLATFDWNQDAITSWNGFTPMLRQTLVRLTYGNVSNPASSGPVIAKFGGPTQSIALRGGTLSQALSNIPALDLPAWWLIGALVFAYVLLVGPVNYFVLRAIGRRALAWVTIPTIALVASAGAYGTSVITKGRAVLANEVSVVHVQPGAARAYLEEYTGIVAPTRGDYQVAVGERRSMIAPIYYYSGNIGDPSLGAMRVNTVNSDIILPGMTAFTLRGFAREGMLANPPDITGQARLAGGQITGTLENSSGLEFTDGVVISGYSYQKLGHVRPGGTVGFSLAAGGNTSLGGPPLTMTIYPSNFQFNGASPNNPSDVERENETRSAVIATLTPYAYGGVPANPQPIAVLWTKQPFQTVTVDGAQPRTFVESAVVLNLPIAQVGAGAVPSGVVAARLVDLDAETTPAGPPGLLMVSSGSITYEFDPALAAGTHLTSASITGTNPYVGKIGNGPNGAPATVKEQAWDWSAASWVDLSYQETGTTTLPDSAVNPVTGQVLIRLSSSGQFSAGYLSLTGTVS